MDDNPSLGPPVAEAADDMDASMFGGSAAAGEDAVDVGAIVLFLLGVAWLLYALWTRRGAEIQAWWARAASARTAATPPNVASTPQAQSLTREEYIEGLRRRVRQVNEDQQADNAQRVAAADEEWRTRREEALRKLAATPAPVPAPASRDTRAAPPETGAGQNAATGQTLARSSGEAPQLVEEKSTNPRAPSKAADAVPAPAATRSGDERASERPAEGVATHSKSADHVPAAEASRSGKESSPAAQTPALSPVELAALRRSLAQSRLPPAPDDAVPASDVICVSIRCPDVATETRFERSFRRTDLVRCLLDWVQVTLPLGMAGKHIVTLWPRRIVASWEDYDLRHVVCTEDGERIAGNGGGDNPAGLPCLGNLFPEERVTLILRPLTMTSDLQRER